MDLLAPARSCLEHFETYWAAQGWELPDRRFISPGSAAAISDDTEQLVVGLVQGAPGPGTRSSLPSAGVGAQGSPAVTYAVRLTRCSHVTDQSVPNADLMHELGEQSLLDAGRILETLLNWRTTLPIRNSINSPFDSLQVQPYGPEGGVHGSQASFVLSSFKREAP